MLSVLELLIKEGFVIFRDDNLVDAERAFFAARAIDWIRKRAPEPGFNLQAYLVALTYYKLGMADMKIENNELLYRYKGVYPGGLTNELSETDSELDSGSHRPDQAPPAKREEEAEGVDHNTESTEGDE